MFLVSYLISTSAYLRWTIFKLIMRIFVDGRFGCGRPRVDFVRLTQKGMNGSAVLLVAQTTIHSLAFDTTLWVAGKLTGTGWFLL